jgi:tetratricopeptide (TPR) repeat protein
MQFERYGNLIVGTASPDTRPRGKSRTEWAAWARQASQDGDWQAALERWDHCIAKFGARPVWLAKKGAALMALERFEDAENLFSALAVESPDDPTALLGLASLATQRRDWNSALGFLTRARAANPGVGTVALANALIRLGQPAEAESLVCGLLAEHPENRKLELLRLRAAIEACRLSGDMHSRRAALVQQTEAYISGSEAESGISAIGLLNLLGERGKAREHLLERIDSPRTLKDVEHCLRAIPLHVEKGSRGCLWQTLLDHVRSTGNIERAQASAIVLHLRLLLALERFAEFCTTFDRHRERLIAEKLWTFLERARSRLGQTRHEVFAEQKVFGIGLTKTGTTSLNEALLMLGIDSGHWINPLTLQPIAELDFYLLGGATDTCASNQFETLYYRYPNARFIWTRRPMEAWQESFLAHHARTNWARGFEEVRALYEREECPFVFHSAAIQFGLYFNSPSLAAALDVYEKRVRHFFSDKPADKLLELDLSAGHGWPELCRFLERPVPDRPFPWANRGARFDGTENEVAAIDS